MTDDLDRELAELLAERRSSSPRKTPDREPVGAGMTRRLLVLTTAAVVSATAVLVLVVAVS